MSSTDERVSDLLAQRARQGSGVHPTLEGVESAITRRAARRRRHRVVCGAMGAVTVIALVAGAVALTRTDGTSTVDGVADLPEVPLVGVDQPGLDLVDTTVRPLGDGTSPTLTYTSFASSEDPAGPVVTVVVDPAGEESPPGGDPVDLDGDGESGGEGDGFITTVGANGGAVGLLWPLPDGRVAGFGGFEVSEEFLVDYVRGLDEVRFDPATIANPDGLDERRTSTLPSAVASQAVTEYGGEDGTLRVTTTNDPAWFDLMRMSMTVDMVGDLADTPLGESFVGPGVAMSNAVGDGSAYALVRTESGLTLEISTEGLTVDVVNQIVAEGRLVEVSPVVTPAATTSLATATTSVPATTSTVPQTQELPSVTRGVDDRGEHLIIEFDEVSPALGALTILESLTGGCARFEEDFERIWQEGGDEPYWQGWLTVELQTPMIGIAGPVFGGPALGGTEDPGYILCNDGDSPARIAIPIANLGEPTVTPLAGRPSIVIDIPAR